MTDYYHPRKAVIIAGARVGSAMLCNALDSHPQISCEREDPLDYKTSPYFYQGLEPHQTLQLVLSRVGYQWCICKVSYRSLKNTISLEDLIEMGVERVIHLWRENALRVVVSAALNTSARNGERKHPTHAWETPEISRIELDPANVLSEARRYILNVRAMQAQLSVCGLPVLNLRYEDIAHPGTAQLWHTDENRVTEFLDVMEFHLTTDTRPINPYPLSEIVTNWSVVKAALAGTELERFCDES
jgi:hypothetical protein